MKFCSPVDNQLKLEQIRISISSSFQIRTFSTLYSVHSRGRVFYPTVSETISQTIPHCQAMRHMRMRNKNTWFNILAIFSHIHLCVCIREGSVLLKMSFCFSFEVCLLRKELAWFIFCLFCKESHMKSWIKRGYATFLISMVFSCPFINGQQRKVLWLTLPCSSFAWLITSLIQEI